MYQKADDLMQRCNGKKHYGIKEAKKKKIWTYKF